MRILLAPNAFKESLTAIEFCEVLSAAFREHDPRVEVDAVPLADGGDGTLEVVTRLWEGSIHPLPTEDPLRRRIMAPVGLDPHGQRAVIEMATTSGLALLAPEERNPLLTTTYGLGLLVDQVIRMGVEDILLCIGGSATNDAGVGMAEALGFRHLDCEGNPVLPTGGRLRRIDRILAPIPSRVPETLRVTVLSDVINPLHGPCGAAVVFAPQKGADSEQVLVLDRGLRHIAAIWERDLGKAVAEVPGAGAAGGMGAGAMVYLNAHLVPGARWMFEAVGLEERIAKADLVITGEGKLDRTTLDGKLPGQVAALAKKHGKRCIGVCGIRDSDSTLALQDAGFETIIPLAEPGISKEVSIRRAGELLRERGRGIAATLIWP